VPADRTVIPGPGGPHGFPTVHLVLAAPPAHLSETLGMTATGAVEARPTLWVVRHGCAGRKAEWRGDDDGRPLDAAGRDQARAVADLLVTRRVGRLRSSPARRCVDTLAPLADRLGAGVVGTDELRPGGPSGGLLAWLARSAQGGDVICTHGEVMRPALAELRRLGAAPAGGDQRRLLAKGVVWELALSPLEMTAHRAVSPVTCPDHP
jgi:8-oxo-dGTP diphosphatase